MAEKKQIPGEAAGPGAIIFGYPEHKDIHPMVGPARHKPGKTTGRLHDA
jgi:hypothetical protein